ncbi:cubilin-like isoform X2 [Branchiostoma floridae x Branchiostoma japonicum]
MALKARIPPLLALLLCLVASAASPRSKRAVTSEQPKMVTDQGHLIFQTGNNYNITFKSGPGAWVNFQDPQDPNAVVDSSSLINMVRQHDQDIGTVPSDISNQLTNLGNSVTTLRQDVTNLQQNQGSTDVTQLQSRLTSLEQTVQQIQASVNTLTTKLTVDECLSNPCRNGGTCMDMYNGFLCSCPEQWQGSTCETDFNECQYWQGTSKGCQNGATCTNTPGGFQCTCTAEWGGALCNVRVNDCSSGSSQDICGHGTCVDMDRTQPGQLAYDCICDDGWKKSDDPNSPACVIDIDECTENNIPPCSHDPPVQCINVPGTYYCGQCPAGYTGNGYACADLNECLTNNGGCSQAPLVQCLNTPGSFFCGNCPAGYTGDGRTCTNVDICSVNNGGCHPLATCTSNPASAGNVMRQCQCPTGFIGSGVGPQGCRARPNPCRPNPCQHGRCRVRSNRNTNNGYRCNCDPGFTGTNCDQNIDECASNPCQNGGTCNDGVNGYSCTCTSSFTGPNCEQAQQTCGGSLSGESGSFTFPLTPGQNYPHGLSCAWVVTTTPGKVLYVTFPEFHLEQATNCQYDWVQIHDGASASAYQIGKYCGQTAPDPITSTHNQLYFWFRSDQSVSGDGFTVVWQSQDPVCGGDLTSADHGSISSPGYPGNYPINRDCVWRIQVSLGNQITFAFAHFALEHHDTCAYDFVEILDGFTETDPSLGKWCSTPDTLPTPITTQGPFAYVRFHSDQSLTDSGFLMTYNAQQIGGGCGGLFTEDEGIMISPNYPNAYPHNQECIWVIRVPDTEVVTLTFTNMDVEAHGNCIWDYVEVRDGGDETAPFVGRYCNQTIPAPFTSTTNQLFVKFRSDASQTGSGFRATWAVTCGGVFTDPTGTLLSPYFPNAYPHEKDCYYTIMQPIGNTITVTFVTFDVEDQSNCLYDYLDVRDGGSADSPRLALLCGTAVPPPVVSTQNVMWLHFHTDASVANNGFRATYDTNQGGCGGTLNDDTGAFTSPGHPTNYPHGARCVWFIEVDPGKVVRLTFHTFSLENHANCNYDYVEVYDNSTSTGTGGLIGRYCGTATPPVVTSAENVMTVIFQSDVSIAREGFTASYVALDASLLCGNALTTSTGIIESPNYPGNYPHNRECEWTITVPTGQQIRLNFTTFSIENHANCNYDYLEVRNGGYSTSPLIGTYCGSTIDNPIVSHSNRLYLKFVTDYSLSGQGFQAEYDGTATGCGGTLTTPTGTFISPNYPLPYDHQGECYWQITVAEGSAILLTFVDFDLESHSRCVYDYVRVYDGPDVLAPLMVSLCGTNIPQPITSSTHQLTIKFRADYSVAGRGFQAAYHSLCDRTITGQTSGAIASPNYPEPYPHNRECTWIIQTTLGNAINVSFTNFNIEDHSSCNYDYIQFRDGSDANSPEIGTYCGTTTPADLRSTDNSLWIKFKSDASVARNGFRFEWVMDGCGGNLNGPTGVLSSPNYPNPYDHRRECLWYITVDPDSSIQLTLHDFDVENHPNCNYDVLEVYGGPDLDSPQLSRICQNNDFAQEMQLSSTGNAMVVRFVTDQSVSGRGFNASYTAVQGGCGGNFSTPSGMIQSPNYPEVYPHNSDCTWTITVEQGKIIVLTFDSFLIESHSSCRYDFVAIYDGPDPSRNGSLIAKVCGSTMPDPNTFRSTGNQMYIRFSSDSSVARRGFHATYTTGCGGLLSADTDGQLTSPNYPSNYERNTNCSWIIYASGLTEHVTLTFTHMDTEDNNGDCGDDYVMVHDGNTQQAPMIGTYCGTRVPAPITSLGQYLTVTFTSDNSIQRSGFSALYTKSISSCGGNLIAEHGAFNSPGYPQNYPINTECVWTITASPGNRVQVSFSLFDLENHNTCTYDYIEIREGTDDSGALLGRFCGQTVPANVTTGHQLWIKFRSDYSLTGAGFMAQYSMLHGGDLTGQAGQLASPLYPRQYPNNVDYIWTISVGSGMRVRVDFVQMNMEGFPGLPGIPVTCAFDWLEFRDGPNPTSPLIGNRLCSTVLPSTVYSTGSIVRVAFHTDYSVTGTGFLFTWLAEPYVSPTGQPATIAPGVCGGDVIAGSSPLPLVSPGWPNGYDHNLDCTWTIRSPAGTHVRLTFTGMSLEAHGTCNYDAVAVIDGDNPQPPKGETINDSQLGKFCGRPNPLPGPLDSSLNAMVVRFTSDYSVNSTGFSATYQAACGTAINADSGAFMSPNFPGNYPNNLDCGWPITVSSGMTISLTFDNTFNIQGSAGNCGGDYLMLLNGDQADSPPLLPPGNSGDGKYCGSSAPTNLPQTGSNRLYARFVSDGSGSSSGFKVNFQAQGQACGGSLTLTNSVTEGFIMSPGYPGNYPVNIDCFWTITAPSAIQLDFVETFYIEPHPNCQYDFVQVFEGDALTSPSLGTFCGTTLPQTVRTVGNTMMVRFRTDTSVQHAGFKAKYSIATCGGRLTGDSGTITSPAYPSNYANNLDCEWLLQGPTGHYVTFTFADQFNVQGSSGNCGSQDYLEIRDGINSTAPALGQYCGSSAPASVDTSDSYAYIRFRTDGSGQAPGFSMTWQASVESCGGQLTTPTGTFTSPNFPGQYPHSRRCLWQITVPQGRRITLTFNAFNIENHSSCRYDYIAVYNGVTPSSPFMTRLCGETPPTPVESTGNTMTVVFQTDGSVSNGGFSATYSSNQLATCGGILSGPPGGGTITSPNYGNGNYSNSQECIWTINNPNPINSSVVLQFTDFELETHGSCQYDFLEIRAGGDMNSFLLSRLCGADTPPTIAVPTNQVWIQFVSDFSIVHPGFSLTYSFSTCGGVLDGTSGTITSPNYPNNYDHNDFCTWLIRAPEGQTISITFTDFAMENHPNCDFDYLTIYNGASVTSPQIGRYCGTASPRSFTSGSRYLLLYFQTDVSASARGFRATYTTDGLGCGGILHGNTGTLMSPNYPQNYPHNLECEWTINVDPGYHVSLNFDPNFFIEAHSACAYDYVMIRDGENENGDDLGTFCANNVPPPVQSTSNVMFVKFRSDYSSSGMGFSANWTVGCGATLTADSGSIMSPGYPTQYDNNLDCNYTIAPSDSQRFIVLEFDTNVFQIEQGTNCRWDYVSVNEGTADSPGQQLGRYCGDDPPSAHSTLGTMFVRFFTDQSVLGQGFRATYTVSECGGRFTDPSGVIASPTHPAEYHNNLNCTYIMTVADNRIVELKFSLFDLEAHSQCNYDYLEVRDGPSFDSPLLAKLCGGEIPDTIRSSGNAMFVSFVTDYSVTADGFRAVYRETFGPAQGCGGSLIADSGTIQPVDIDNNGQYENNQDCTWTVTAADTKVISLSFDSFALEAESQCRYDYLQIRDGPSEQDPLIGTYCGSTIPPAFNTSTNFLWIRFYSDQSVTNTGFVARWQAVDSQCGGTFNATSTPQTLTSPNYPGNYPHNLNCRWTIQAPGPAQRLRIKITDMQIEAHPNCQYDYLQLRDYPMDDTGRTLTYCGRQLIEFDSRKPTLQLNFRTDVNSAGRGFYLTYEIASCSRNITADNGRLVSPGWPDNYPHNSDCRTILRNPGRYIAVYFNEFYIEPHANCNYDYLAFYNGTSTSDTQLAKYCGQTIPDPIFPQSDVILMQFVTDSSVSHAGYDLTFSTSRVSSGCGGNLMATQGSFTSPDYPQPYNHQQTCNWLIRVAAGRVITLVWDVFELESEANCNYDYVELYNGANAQAPLVGRYCGNTNPADYTSTTNMLYIRFRADQSVNGAGFRITYSS